MLPSNSTGVAKSFFTCRSPTPYRGGFCVAKPARFETSISPCALLCALLLHTLLHTAPISDECLFASCRCVHIDSSKLGISLRIRRLTKTLPGLQAKLHRPRPPPHVPPTVNRFAISRLTPRCPLLFSSCCSCRCSLSFPTSKHRTLVNSHHAW